MYGEHENSKNRDVYAGIIIVMLGACSGLLGAITAFLAQGS
jgi:hypothetical protein